MQRSDWSRIAHGDLEFMGPYDETSFERLLDGAELPAGARVLDLGCGKGALCLLYISEPTRRVVISYAVFCL
jgi:cyclopropane fatty-acyl-phospholipid synthase-like methyltransferase